MKKTATATATAAKTNPLTTIFGILTMAAGLAPIWAPARYSPQITATASLLSGVGLAVAADANAKRK